MSSKYDGPPNSYEQLLTNDENTGCGTNSGRNQYIEANLGSKKHVDHVEIKGCGSSMAGGWASGNKSRYGVSVEYLNPSTNKWVKLADYTSNYMPNNKITKLNLKTETQSIRILSNGSYCCIGTLRIYSTANDLKDYDFVVSGLLPYKLNMSSKYGGPPNSYDHLISNDVNMGTGTNHGSKKGTEWIEARLSSTTHVNHIEVRGCGSNMSGGWVYGHGGCSSYPCYIEYQNSSNEWVALKDYTAVQMRNDKMTFLDIKRKIQAIRICNSKDSYASIGTLRIYKSSHNRMNDDKYGMPSNNPMCVSCKKVLNGKWEMTKAGGHYDKTGRYLGIRNGYFLYGENSNFVYCYCKSCWKKEVKKLSFISNESKKSEDSDGGDVELLKQLEKEVSGHLKKMQTKKNKLKNQLQTIQNDLSKLSVPPDAIQKSIEPLNKHINEINPREKSWDLLKQQIIKMLNDQ